MYVHYVRTYTVYINVSIGGSLTAKNETAHNKGMRRGGGRNVIESDLRDPSRARAGNRVAACLHSHCTMRADERRSVHRRTAEGFVEDEGSDSARAG